MTVEATYGLSPMQEGMLFHHLSGEHHGADFEQIVCTIRHWVDVGAFERAWVRLIRRHEVLRTSFRWKDVDKPVQEVHSEISPTILVEDWCDVEGKQARLDDFLHADRARGVDFSHAGLARLSVIRADNTEFWMVLSFPHIILDGRSFPIVLDDLFSYYQEEYNSTCSTVSTVPLYKEFIEWHQAQDWSLSESYWRTELAGVIAATTLPQDTSSLAYEGEHYGTCETRLSPELTSSLSRIAETGGFTLNNLVQGAWALLLNAWTGEERVVFGVTRSGRRLGLPNWQERVGLFINTLPLVVNLDPENILTPWIKSISDRQLRMRDHEQTPLVNIKQWSEVHGASSLFESIIVFDNESLDRMMEHRGYDRKHYKFELHEQTTFPLALYANGGDELQLKLSYDKGRLSDERCSRMLAQLQTILEGFASQPQGKLADFDILAVPEREEIIQRWNKTSAPVPSAATINELFEKQVSFNPGAIALAYQRRSLTYAELDAKANALAGKLRSIGVGPEILAGICTDRSPDMVVAVLAVLKAGGGYVPLDPTFPAERLRFITQDAGIHVLLTQSRHNGLIKGDFHVLLMDDDLNDEVYSTAPRRDLRPSNVAYVLYTSGSTGRPKGVVVEHRSVINFFVAMDQQLTYDPPGVWLAVTSLSFDISVLELLWTLTRGFKVVLYEQPMASPGIDTHSQNGPRPKIDFSLSYFASAQAQDEADKYRILVEGAKFADEHDFAAVWTPERHFHDFGAIYPNPSVLSAALSVLTQRVGIRAGSVVLPLHSPLRVAEEWSVVDNLSNGRVSISFAPGWQPIDFILKPENFGQAREAFIRDIELVRGLWRGETVSMSDPKGSTVNVATRPRPIQPELPFWITSAGSPKTFELAGDLGANVLTHLLGQSHEELARNIGIYRSAWKASGHHGEGHVTLMVHTFIGEDDETVRLTVHEPMIAYLGASLSLIRGYATSFPPFQKRIADGQAADDLFDDLSAENVEALLEHSFQRYLQSGSLLGSIETCLQRLQDLADIGVDEVACLIDFGVHPDLVLSKLENLNRLKREWAEREFANDYSLANLITSHGVTHMQCTPSFAMMMTQDPEAKLALGQLQQLLVGGEAFPVPLARELLALQGPEVINMYGPTETTIWSATHVLKDAVDQIPIGRPIANTQFYLLDKWQRPVPQGATGELYIGGDGLAREYLGRPELTAERFIRSRLAGDAVIYRTGDLARYLPSGAIEFLGRSDAQVKVRGHRIELGEIETVLAEHEQIQEAVVVVSELSENDKRLVACLVPRRTALASDDELRSHCRAKLPEYMVPSYYVRLDEMPRTPNGKTDRLALAAIKVDLAEERQSDVDGDLEATIAEIWCAALNSTSVSVTTNFFEAGGHSLLAVQIHRQLVERVNPDLRLMDVFRFPTIRSLSQYLSSTQDHIDSSAAARGVDIGRRRREMIAARSGAAPIESHEQRPRI